MSLQARRRAAAALGLCWVCRRPNREVGQRGPRQAHYHCKKLVDHGYRLAQARRIAEATC